MQYVLGNMLNGGGINPDGLSLDLQFATDKTLTARRGPTPTFTRGSGATYIGSDGLIHGIDTSTTSNSISAASKTFTLDATAGQDQLWRTGDAVEASSGANIMAGTVTSYNATTQSLVCNMTTASGSGTFTSWRIGYRGPRFDHTAAGVCRGLLIEEGRTNAFQHSSNFKDTTSSNYWANQTATTITVDQIASPDGGVNADLLSTSTSSFDCFTRRSNFWAGSTQYTYSIFVKRGPSNYRYVGLYIGAGATATQFPYFDFDNPTTVQIPTITSGTINSTRVDAYPNGWYRIIITFTTAATPITLFGGVYISASNGVIQENNTAGNNCYIWGIQSELGSFPTSYIPTTTGTLARSADVCSIANTASFWNSSEFTVFTHANFVTSGIDTYASNFNITSGFFGVRRNGSNVASAIIRSSGVNADINLGAFATGSMRMAAAHSTGQQAAALNGGSATQASSAFSPSLNPALNIGYSGTTGYINGHIAAIRYYKKRLPNAKLVALTT
jgi:hypothetical protein